MAASRTFALHESVPLRWWLYHLPLSEGALHFRRTFLETGRAKLLAPETLVTGLLADVASDCSNFPVPISGDIVDALFDDILETLRVMEASRTLSVVSVRPLLAAAFRISCQSLMTLSDALVVVLAVSQGIPVLIGDETARERIHASSVLGVVPEVVSVSEL